MKNSDLYKLSLEELRQYKTEIIETNSKIAIVSLIISIISLVIAIIL